MQTASATDVKNRFGEFMEIARIEPVTVQKTGRDAVVIISHQEYERLTRLEDQYWGMKAAEIERSGVFIGHDEAMAVIQSRLNEIGGEG